MKRQSTCLFMVTILLLLGLLAQNGRGDFVLTDDQWVTVNSYHSTGTLYDTSRAFIVSGGYVPKLSAYDSSVLNISDGYVQSLLYAYDSSTVDISGGSVWSLPAYNSSTVNISGGSVPYLYGLDSSTVNISGGYVHTIDADNSSTVNICGGFVTYIYSTYGTVAISGGSVTNLSPNISSTVNISGGSIINLYAKSSSVATFYGHNFRVADGLVFDGDYILGTGLLAGEWFDGRPWVVCIVEHSPSATILVTSDSAPKPPCVKYPAMDFNGDYKVDFSDLAIFLTHWLECNLDPPSACWE